MERRREEGSLRIQLLGAFRVWVGSRPVPDTVWRRRKAANLIKLLAVAPEHRLHREEVLELLWPGLDPAAADNNLHRTLHIVRHVLDRRTHDVRRSRFLGLQGEVLVLAPDVTLQIDVDTFLQAARIAGQSQDPDEYERAVSLYTGDLLPEDSYEDWAAVRREELRRRYRDLLSQLSQTYEERKQYGRAIEALRRLVDSEPTEEAAHLRLMRLYALSGQRPQALQQYDRLADSLRRELDVEPDTPARRLVDEIRTGRFPPEPPASSIPAERAHLSPPTNLPHQESSFVGREQEIGDVKRLLSSTRLLTLTGAGGVGKSRLAVQVAAEVLAQYREGAWLIQLAALSDPGLVARTVADALGVEEQPGRSVAQALVDFLQSRELLLILDNCEHLLDGCAALSQALLEGSPRLRILATSRHPLDIPGESTWRVPSLAVPAPDHDRSLTSLFEYDAVALFLERVRSVQPDFVLTPENAASIIDVCGRLDGIPLAIELAAARMRVLTAEQLADRLDDCFAALGSGRTSPLPRHRTLRATMDWSHDLLSVPERRLFRRLAVFAGGCPIEAVEEVCRGDGIEGREVLDLLAELVDHSMVVVVRKDAVMRYRLLEPVRQYAAEKLAEASDVEATRRRHAEWYGRLAERAESELTGPEQAAWLERLETEHDNLRAALQWLLEEGKILDLLHLAIRLARFWSRHAHFNEGVRWLEQALTLETSLPKDIHAETLQALATLVQSQGHEEKARVLCEECLRLRRELGDELGAARELNQLGLLAWCRSDYERAGRLYEEALALFRKLENADLTASTLHNLGLARLYQGNRPLARALEEESLALFQTLGNQEGVAWATYSLGLVALHGGDTEHAAPLLKDSLNVFRQLGYRAAVAYALQALGTTAAISHEPERAARLTGAAQAIVEELGGPFPANEREMFERFLAHARAEIGQEAFDRAQEEGRAMPLKAIVEDALWTGTRTQAGSAVTQEQRPLTRREREVATLIGRGLTNQEIAAELGLSQPTVALHVHHILKKLGATSRRAIARSIRGEDRPWREVAGKTR